MTLQRRRLLIHSAAAWAWAAHSTASAQTATRVYRVGVLRPTARPASATDLAATGMAEALRALGYIEGQNLRLDARWADGQPERLPGLASELVQAKMDVIVAVGAQAVRAVQAVPSTLPVVLFGNFDPVALGLVASLARPAGHVTGVLIAPNGTLAGKRLELLKLVVPKSKRIGFLLPPDDFSVRAQALETHQAAAALGLELLPVTVQGWDYAQAFNTLAAQRPGAVLVASSSHFLRDRQRIIELAAKHRLPAIYEWREHVVDGGLMTYATSLRHLYERLADYVDRILKGAKPADMPVEQPTRFELVINLKTAAALGLTLPQALLLRADEVIQ